MGQDLKIHSIVSSVMVFVNIKGCGLSDGLYRETKEAVLEGFEL